MNENRQSHTRAAIVLLCVLPGVCFSLDGLALGDSAANVLGFALLFVIASSAGYLFGSTFSGEVQTLD